MPYLERKTYPVPCKKNRKIELLEKAHSAIILSLGDTVLREVAKAKSAAEVWLKLESLYMTKSLANRLHKKIKLYTFQDDPSPFCMLENYKKQEESKEESGHFKKDCPDRRQNTVKKTVNEGDAAVILDGYDSAEVLNVAEVDSGKEWILDSGCSFHICPIKAWFEDFKEADGGYVLLGNNKHCKILGTGTVRISTMMALKEFLKMLGQTVTGKVSTVLKEDVGTTKLWHQRLGHISHRGLQELEKQGVLGNYKLTDLPFCEHCVFGKATGRKVKKLRTDNGLEFLSNDFNSLCQKEGIARHRTVRYTPQQNGLAERMNRTILERVRCMLSSSGLSKVFWAETAETAVHLINRSPSSALQFKTPQEKWTGKAARLSTSQSFWMHSLCTHQTDKLEPRAVKCIFLGYPKGVKGYKLWIETQGKGKCIISRDVTFNEQDMSKQTPAKDVEGLDQLQFEVEHETLQPEKSKETSSKTAQEEIVHERQNEPTQGWNPIICVAEEIVDMEPKTYQEAINSNEADQWVKAIQEEMDSLRKNETWELVTKPKDRKVVGSKWVFKRKQGTLGNEAPSSIRLLLAFVAHEDLELDQLDVKTAFLHGELDELIYMQPPEGFGEGIKDGQPRDFGNGDRKRQEQEVSTPLGQHFRLSITQAPETHEEKRFMERIPYASMVGSVMYTMVCSRPDLGICAGTRSLGLVYGGNSQLETQLQGFVDADYAGNIDTRKSLTGYVFTLFGGAAVKEAIWLKGITEELAMYRGKVVVYCDNQSAIHLAKNQSFHERSKHIDVRLHFVRDIIAAGEIGVGKIAEDFPLGKVLRPEGSSDTCQLNRVQSREKQRRGILLYRNREQETESKKQKRELCKSITIGFRKSVWM
ncbi:Retrovirus-related Pol polyprotein from transposon TNT 1-94 [Vitis vinifera]|uniref:Retrovirus-related Pol polyprotein from transposon TNT 1-94 n=1 Tax=Vitis vinifera TaxID=29760 RepID=A0A438CFF3_VITVI|nr:Retrovirus-related Pol polyprotein from transposon TNT 1-94 [Vitis vinifera]